MTHTMRSSGDQGTNATERPATERPAAGVRPIAGQLSLLPRPARRGKRGESAAERVARRRREAQATLVAESSHAGTDWGQVGVFGAGVAIGALIGAGAALLLAQATGYAPRARRVHRD